MSDSLLTYAAQFDGEPACRCTTTDKGTDTLGCDRHEQPALDADVLAALEAGELTQDQLRRLIVWEAGQMGLSFDQAAEQFEAGALPRTALGLDVDLLLRMYDDTAAPRAPEGEGE